MFIFGYFVVTLTLDRRPTFPARCVVCGKAVSTFNKVFSTPGGGHYLRLLSWTTIEAPTHEDCAKVLLHAHYLLFFRLGVLLMPIMLITYMILGSGNIWKLLVVLIAYLLLTVPVYLWVSSRWKPREPVPFRFESLFGESSYGFMDKEYAEEFASINNTVIGPQ